MIDLVFDLARTPLPLTPPTYCKRSSKDVHWAKIVQLTFLRESLLREFHCTNVLFCDRFSLEPTWMRRPAADVAPGGHRSPPPGVGDRSFVSRTYLLICPILHCTRCNYWQWRSRCATCRLFFHRRECPAVAARVLNQLLLLLLTIVADSRLARTRGPTRTHSSDTLPSN